MRSIKIRVSSIVSAASLAGSFESFGLLGITLWHLQNLMWLPSGIQLVKLLTKLLDEGGAVHEAA